MQKSTLADYFNEYYTLHSNQNIMVQSRAFDLTEYLKEGLSEKDLIKLKETFDYFDIDKSNFISPIKLRAAFKNFANLSVTKETIYHMICEFDNEENGELTFSDFVKLASPLFNQKSTSKSDVKLLFRQFDKENKGYLILEDLKNMGSEITDIFGNAEVADVFSNCSLDGKVITFDEFYGIMNYKLY